MGKHAESTDKRVISRIYGHKGGWVFTPDDFLDLGSREAIGHALLRYEGKNIIRKLARGLYHHPKKDPELGILEPSIESIAKALAGKDAARLQPTGGFAANLLGLSTQVPMKTVFLTEGRGKTVRIGKREIILKKTTVKTMKTAGKISGLLNQAFKILGRGGVTPEILKKIGNRLTEENKKQLLKDIWFVPSWVGKIFRDLARGTTEKWKK